MASLLFMRDGGGFKKQQKQLNGGENAAIYARNKSSKN